MKSSSSYLYILILYSIFIYLSIYLSIYPLFVFINKFLIFKKFKYKITLKKLMIHIKYYKDIQVEYNKLIKKKINYANTT